MTITIHDRTFSIEPSFYCGRVDGIESCVDAETGEDARDAFYAAFTGAREAHGFVEQHLDSDDYDGFAWADARDAAVCR